MKREYANFVLLVFAWLVVAAGMVAVRLGPSRWGLKVASVEGTRSNSCAREAPAPVTMGGAQRVGFVAER